MRHAIRLPLAVAATSLWVGSYAAAGAITAVVPTAFPTAPARHR